jgi:hypothetical protein
MYIETVDWATSMPSLSSSPWLLGATHREFLKTHSSDQVAHLFADPRSALGGTRLPAPVSGKTLSMPAHDSLGPDDGNGVNKARTATIEPDEQDTVGPTQMHSTWCALLQNIELMSQNQDFGFQLPSRLAAVGQQADEKEANCDHQPQSCSDSATAVTPWRRRRRGPRSRSPPDRTSLCGRAHNPWLPSRRSRPASNARRLGKLSAIVVLSRLSMRC